MLDNYDEWLDQKKWKRVGFRYTFFTLYILKVTWDVIFSFPFPIDIWDSPKMLRLGGLIPKGTAPKSLLSILSDQHICKCAMAQSVGFHII